MSEAEIAEVAAVRRACAAVDGHDPLDEAADLALRHHGVAGALLRTQPGGFALERDGDLLLAVAPDRRGAGLASRLLADVVAAGAADRAWSHGDHPAAAALATRHGWERTRELWVMRRSLTVDLPPLVVPDAVVVRGYRDTDADALLAVNAAAFAAHPEQGDLDAAGLAERMAESWFDPAGLLVAEADGELLGFHWTKRHDARTGEVYVVGIGPAAQGRGLGRVLTAAGLHHLAEGGASEVLLYVESDNRSATALYGSLGFTHAAADTHVQYTGPGALRDHPESPG